MTILVRILSKLALARPGISSIDTQLQIGRCTQRVQRSGSKLRANSVHQSLGKLADLLFKSCDGGKKNHFV